MSYTATYALPGCLPDSDQPAPVFATAAEAWQFLADEIQRTDAAWMPDDDDDADGPQSLRPFVIELEQRAARTAADGTSVATVGTVYGTDGYAYSVDYADDDDDTTDGI